MNTPAVITIDGPAGAGKSTLGEHLARRLGFLFFDTGIMYRALAWAALQHQADFRDAARMAALAREIDLKVSPPTADDGRQYTVLLDNEDITWKLRRPDVEANVSLAASYPQVREVMRQRQRAIGEQGQVVMVGRDIGSVVMPDAPAKIYLLASLEERAWRRMNELQSRGLPADLERIRQDIARRDQLDSHVMAPAPDAMLISSDGHTPEQVADIVIAHFGSSF